MVLYARWREHKLSITDGLLAATAFERDLALVTRNTKDFAGLGVRLIDPWNA